MVALRLLEICFWPVKSRKNLVNFEMHTCHWLGAQRWFSHKVKKPVTSSLLLDCIDGCYASVFIKSFFMLCFRFQIEVFSYCNLTEGFAIGFQKWFDHEWIDFGVFCSKMAFLVYFISLWTEIWNKMLKCLSHCQVWMFLTFTLRGILVCSLQMLVPFNQRIL